MSVASTNSERRMCKSCEKNVCSYFDARHAARFHHAFEVTNMGGINIGALPCQPVSSTSHVCV